MFNKIESNFWFWYVSPSSCFKKIGVILHVSLGRFSTHLITNRANKIMSNFRGDFDSHSNSIKKIFGRKPIYIGVIVGNFLKNQLLRHGGIKIFGLGVTGQGLRDQGLGVRVRVNVRGLGVRVRVNVRGQAQGQGLGV